jgi:hypothetical protein
MAARACQNGSSALRQCLSRRGPTRPAFKRLAFSLFNVNTGMGRPIAMSALLSIARTLGAYMLFRRFRTHETNAGFPPTFPTEVPQRRIGEDEQVDASAFLLWLLQPLRSSVAAY